MMLKKYGAHSVTITPQMKSAAYNFLTSGMFILDHIYIYILHNIILCNRALPKHFFTISG